MKSGQKDFRMMEKAYDRFLRTLCNKTRLSIIQLLMEKPKNVSQLTKELKTHQTSVSHALRRLLDCGFVFVEKRGSKRIYSLNEKTIKPLAKLMDSHIRSYCAKRCRK